MNGTTIARGAASAAVLFLLATVLCGIAYPSDRKSVV